MKNILLLLSSLMCVSVWSAERDFSTRFSTNASGNIFIIGNTVVTCPDSLPECISGRNGIQVGTGTGRNSNVNNQYYDSTPGGNRPVRPDVIMVDIDPSAPGNNSSSSDLNLPAGSSILWAGLYWGGGSTSATRGTVSLKAPGGGYQTITASQLDDGTTGTGTNRNYQGFAEITNIVAANGSGSYTVADIKTNLTDGGQHYGGWSIIVAYGNPSEPTRNLSVFDGYKTVRNGSPVDLTVSGFLTPAFGDVKADIGVVAYEGDLERVNDFFSLEGQNLSDAVNPANNMFNSVISRYGSHYSARNPSYINTFGYDSVLIDTVNLLPNNATSADIRLSRSGDLFYSGVVTFSVELFVPDLVQEFSKTAEDINGAWLQPGEIIEYSISLENTGNDGAEDAVINDPIPVGTQYVPNSLRIVSGANAGVKTDVSGDDQAEYDATNNQVVIRVGAGANSSMGGSFAPGQATEVSFQVQVDDDTYGDSLINQAIVTYEAATLGDEITESISASIDVAEAVVLSNQKNTEVIEDPVNLTSNPKAIPGALVLYTVKIQNQGLGHIDTDTVTLVDTIPDDVEVFTGDFDAGSPYQFIDGALSSGLSCVFVSLSDSNDCIDYSDDNGASWNYVPNGGYDDAVTDIRFKLSGAFNIDNDANAPFPEFEVKFQSRVK